MIYTLVIVAGRMLLVMGWENVSDVALYWLEQYTPMRCYVHLPVSALTTLVQKVADPSLEKDSDVSGVRTEGAFSD